MEAQKTTNTAVGEYYLRGVMETASGFKLNPDSSFQFFFAYGALDRSGYGTWKQEGKHIVFNSKEGSKGFVLMSSKTVEEDKLSIKIADANPSLRSHVYALMKSGNQELEAMTDQNGMIHFPKQPFDSIMLMLEFCPEKVFVLQGNDEQHNNFEFRFEKDIMDVFFKELSLELGAGEMLGQHPLLKEGIYQFKKSGN